MPEKGEKSDNLNILENIYDDSPDQQDPLILPKKSDTSFRDYFNNKEKVDRALSFAILFFGLAAVVLGFFKFQDNVKGAFVIDNTEVEKIGLNNLNAPDEDLLGLRNKDTDQDGLSDYDELYVYATSPFLPDSDSDGISDQQEIADGTDPNCPTGKNCFAIGVSDPTGLNAKQGQEYADLLLGSNDKIANLRLVLQQAGLSAAELSQFSDTELLQIYQDILLGVSEASSTTIPILPTSDASLIQSPSSNDLENLTPIQLRNLLKLSGVSDGILNSVSDQELLDLVQETSKNSLGQ